MNHRFKFGENWLDFSQKVSPLQKSSAQESLLRLLDKDEIAGNSVLDIGSGSGIHSASFLNLGARHVTAVDYDEWSVETTKRMLSSHPASLYEVSKADILDLTSMPTGKFDIVYSWGVLHHTGHMRLAIENAMTLVKPGGLLVVALYRRTPFCSLWRFEKRLYSRATPQTQKRVLRIYKLFFSIALLLAKGKLISTYQENYQSRRGMNLSHDFHDWLGGYPYESISPKEFDTLVHRDFSLIRKFTKIGTLNILGSGCDEFVYKKK